MEVAGGKGAGRAGGKAIVAVDVATGVMLNVGVGVAPTSAGLRSHAVNRSARITPIQINDNLLMLASFQPSPDGEVNPIPILLQGNRI